MKWLLCHCICQPVATYFACSFTVHKCTILYKVLRYRPTVIQLTKHLILELNGARVVVTMHIKLEIYRYIHVSVHWVADKLYTTPIYTDHGKSDYLPLSY